MNTISLHVIVVVNGREPTIPIDQRDERRILAWLGEYREAFTAEDLVACLDIPLARVMSALDSLFARGAIWRDGASYRIAGYD